MQEKPRKIKQNTIGILQIIHNHKTTNIPSTKSDLKSELRQDFNKLQLSLKKKIKFNAHTAYGIHCIRNARCKDSQQTALATKLRNI